MSRIFLFYWYEDAYRVVGNEALNKVLHKIAGLSYIGYKQ